MGEGESVDVNEGKEDGNKVVEDVYDGAGNKIDVKKSVTLSAKDVKKAIKDLEKKLKDGKKKKTMTEEEMWEMEDQLNELKEKVKSAELVSFCCTVHCAEFILPNPKVFS